LDASFREAIVPPATAFEAKTLVSQQAAFTLAHVV
jgi:hypothetical protein